MIGIVDYGAGNLTSVANALNHLGVENAISDQPDFLKKCDRIIFPGVGAAGASMRELAKRGLDVALKEIVEAGTPVLGICVGCQIVLNHSEEDGGVQCLGLLPGTTVRFQSEKGLKIPHMGWNQVEWQADHPVFAGIPSGTEFYFVHSFHPADVPEKNQIGKTTYGTQNFVSIHGSANVVATQFHCEKSGLPGLKVLENFSKWEGDFNAH